MERIRINKQLEKSSAPQSIIRSDSSNELVFMPIGTAGQVLGVNAANELEYLTIDYVESELREVSASTTISIYDYTIVYTVAGITQAVPTSVNKQIINLKNGSSGVLTLTGHFDNVASSTIILSAKSSLQLHGNGVTWWVI